MPEKADAQLEDAGKECEDQRVVNPGLSEVAVAAVGCELNGTSKRAGHGVNTNAACSLQQFSANVETCWQRTTKARCSEAGAAARAENSAAAEGMWG